MDNPTNLPRLLSVKEALQVLGMGRTNFYAKLNAGKFKAVKIGRRTLVSEIEILRFMQGLEFYHARLSPSNGHQDQ